MNPFAILWRSVVEVYDNLFPLVGMNLLWLVLSIPLVLVVTGILLLFRLDNTIAFPIAILFAILAPNPGSIGIHNYANRLVHDELLDFGLFWSGLRQYWRKSLVLALLAVVGAAILGVNIYFYVNSESQILRIFAILWLYAIVLWAMMCLYMSPLLLEQENKSIVLIVKNSFLLCLDNLIPSIVILIILVAVSLLSIVIALLVALVTGSLAAMVETQAVHAYLEKYRQRAAKSAA
jgi:uncharacterized membrane protein YesL